MLLGRALEQARIDLVLADARLGSSSALVLRGDPGIGKSSLLRYAVEQAGAMRVLSARGVQFEADVPFAGLHELLRPALGSLDRLPGVHERALLSALGLGERLESDRLLIGAATLGLITAWTDSGPLLIALDDAQWLDRASAEAIAFTARRLLADPVAIVVAIRDGESSPLLEAGLAELAVGGLDPEPAAALLESAANGPLSPELTRRLLDATAGNPLALLELVGEAAQIGDGPEDRPLAIATTVERAYLRRLVELSAGVRTALLLVAASGSADLETVRTAAQALGVSPRDVEAAEDAGGLVRQRERRVEFVHPLARAAVYHAASPADRRAAHRALAAASNDPDDDRRAWHLAAAAAGPDEEAAAGLERAGLRARARTGHAAAAAAFEEAARLTAEPEARAARLLSAAENAWLAGQADRAVDLISRARVAAVDDSLQAELDVMAAQIAFRRGEVGHGFALLRGASGRLRRRDRIKAIRALADASIVSFGAGRVADSLATAKQALDLLEPGDPSATGIHAHVAYGTAAVVAGLGTEGPDHLRRAAELFGPDPELGPDPLLIMCAAMLGLFLRDAGTARVLLERALVGAQERAPAAALPAVLFYLARDAATTERWTFARGGYEESVRIARETTQYTWLCCSLSALAWLDAQEGRDDDCRGHAEEALALAERYGMDTYRSWALTALAILEQGLGRPEAALVRLLEIRRLFDRLGVADPDVDPAPDLVDAYLRLGQTEPARAAAAAYRPIAEAKGQPFALARACRASAQVASDSEFAALFEEALGYHGRTVDTFERARTQLCYGERLRRTRRRADARRHLADALEAFDRLGASPWAQRALAELGASGQTARRRDDAARHRLTPQELQIALALAEGRTTREAAGKLFLSPKTVEYHLRNVYDKLGIRSREELQKALGATV